MKILIFDAILFGIIGYYYLIILILWDKSAIEISWIFFLITFPMIGKIIQELYKNRIEKLILVKDICK
jgi:hypothetical protein